MLDEAKRQREEAKKSNNSAATPATAKTLAASTDATSVSGTSNAPKSSSKKDDAQRRQQQSDAAKPLRKELEKIDRQLLSLNSEKANLQTLLTTAKAPAELAQTGKRLKTIEADLLKLEERWLLLTEQIETAAV